MKTEKKPIDADGLFRISVATCSKLLDTEGSIMGMAVVHDTEGDVFGFPYKTSPATAYLERQVIVGVCRGAREAGRFAGVALVAEGWMSRVPLEKAALSGVMLPSQDPDRQEVVLVYCLDASGKMRFGVFALDRSGARPRLGADLGAGDEFSRAESWLQEITR